MGVQIGIGLIAIVVLIAALSCSSPNWRRGLALLSSGLFLLCAILIGAAPFIVLAGLLTVISALRLWALRKARAPTRAAWRMDDDVQERVREIQATSRYSSAGIEF